MKDEFESNMIKILKKNDRGYQMIEIVQRMIMIEDKNSRIPLIEREREAFERNSTEI